MTDPTSHPGFADPDHDSRMEAEREKARLLRDEPTEPEPIRFHYRDAHSDSCDYWDRIISRVEKSRGWS